MVQFKDYFLGTAIPPHLRVTTAQKCIRVGGKHNDLENVGKTARHHSFFEMLGNFSFGSYGKSEAIHYAWEFLTDVVKLPKNRLRVTVHKDDLEAQKIWKEQEGLTDQQIILGEEDNFWSMGHGKGPCGPCTEIFYDQQKTDSDGERWLEIWNLVFMQYYRNDIGLLTPLNKLCIDTGMGLERLSSVLQGKSNNFQIDLFQNLIDHIHITMKQSNIQRPIINNNNNNDKEDEYTIACKVIADHLRASSFLIADGVLPSNVGRGYVLRRIIRRAVRFGHKLGFEAPFLSLLFPSLVDIMGNDYKELKERSSIILSILQQEESMFFRTLNNGLKLITNTINKIDNNRNESNNKEIIPSEVVFQLYDTYGFPFDLTEVIATESNKKINYKEVEELMKKQKELSRTKWKGSGDIVIPEQVKTWLSLNIIPQFTGYTNLAENQSTIIASYINEEQQTLYLTITPCPFYGNGGGQLGDKGTIEFTNGTKLKVIDTIQPYDNGIALVIQDNIETIEALKLYGQLNVGTSIKCEVDKEYRNGYKIHHSATHILQSALIKIIGKQVQQAGSLVSFDKLRFDFTHSKPLTPIEIKQIEEYVNNIIKLNVPVDTQVMKYDDAIKTNAIHLFNEKYSGTVRVVQIGDHSHEFCGGTHVNNSGEILLFKIISERSIGTGTRRIEAVVGQNAIKWYIDQNKILEVLCNKLDVQPKESDKRVDKLLTQLKSMEKDIENMESQIINFSLQSNKSIETTCKGTYNSLPVKIHIFENNEDTRLLRKRADILCQSENNYIHILLSGKSILCSVAEQHNKTSKMNVLLSNLLLTTGGTGGGSPSRAQGQMIQNESEVLQKLQNFFDNQV